MKKLIAANWKLQKSPKETEAYFRAWATEAEDLGAVDFVFFPPATNLEAAARSGSVSFGAQNCYFEKSGAFTGEISASVAKEIGAEWILLGHSERRSLFFETNEMISKKLRLVHELGLQPMLCVGESLEEREGEVTEMVLRKQLTESLQGLKTGSELTVAYEPVWAIGTGRVAGPDQVAHAHAFVREVLIELGFGNSRILYGGSVKADNAGPLSKISHVDGFLVGGASLEPSSFAAIAKACL